MGEIDKQEEIDEWEKMEEYGYILTKHNTTVTLKWKNKANLTKRNSDVIGLGEKK